MKANITNNRTDRLTARAARHDALKRTHHLIFSVPTKMHTPSLLLRKQSDHPNGGTLYTETGLPFKKCQCHERQRKAEKLLQSKEMKETIPWQQISRVILTWILEQKNKVPLRQLLRQLEKRDYGIYIIE